MSWQNYSLIRLIIPFTLGMIGANLFISHMNGVVLFILCCVVLAFSFFFLKTSETYKDGRFGLVAMVLFCLIGMTLYTGKYHHIEKGTPVDSTFVKGILVEPPKEKAHSWALELKQENGIHIILYIGGEIREGLSLGDTIYANIRHLHPTNHCEDDSFQTYNTYLFHHGICATAYAPHHQWVVKPCTTPRSFFLFAKNVQERLHQIYEEHGISDEAGSIIEAMTIGRKTDLSKDTRNAFAHAGISHILALSGFHVGIIVLMIQVFFLKTLLPIRWQWVSNLFIIATLWGYAFLTGLSPSLVRATTMFTILLLCQSLQRDAFSPNSCALAFLIMLCINPFYLHDIGFQLSFIAVGSIGLLGNRLLNLHKSSNKFVHYAWLITIVAVSLISSIFTAPLVAHYFGRFTLISLLGNLIIFPFVYLLMLGSILWWLFLWCDSINNLLTDLLNWTANTMSSITEHLASIPFATIEWSPNILTTLLCYVVLLIFSYFFLQIKRN
ncbi:MAG: ComEC/Rec2 family competence protein [Bacteroidaceae bacterium]|nr:ComEC/Rec2 family competence protein [Bacteroidaceae bacterium]